MQLIARLRLSILVVLRLALIPGLLTACDNSQREIVGMWRAGDEPNGMVWEFTSNGRAVTGNTPGHYSFGDSHRIKIQTPSATFVYQIELNGDRMILKDATGTRMEFTRLK